MLNGLSLFSGIGGIDLALSEWVRPVAYCEIEPYAAGVIFSRMLDGSLPTAPIFPDVRHITADILPSIDIVYGGFPCQDISVAGRGAGLEGERSGLFFEIVRLLGELRPRFCFLENVPAITSRGGWRVVGELAALGYDARWGVLSAYDVGAPHIRERFWLLAADADSDRCQQQNIHLRPREQNQAATKPRRGSAHLADAVHRRWRKYDPRGCEVERSNVRLCEGREEDSGGTTIGSAEMADAESERRQRSGSARHGRARLADGDWWTTEPDVGGVVNGLPLRVDRIRCLGNAVVPQCAKEAFKRLMGL